MKPFEKKIYLSSPTMHGDEMKYIKEAYKTNWMSTVGANLDAIEKELGEFSGNEYAVALGTGTAAIHLALRVAGERLYGHSKGGVGTLTGKRVFCTDMTFAATVNPVVYEGGEPVFIDSERDTWNMDPLALKKAFEKFPDTKIVVMVHLYGVPAKINEIKKVCKDYDAILIEDAAESLGATYLGRQTGGFGDYNAISFNGNKIITGSSGGMFLSNSKEAANKVRKWSTQSRELAPWYQHEDLGYNYRMSNVVAGVVRGQIPYLSEHIVRKKAIYERYKEGFKDLPVCMNPFDDKTSVPNYWLSCMTINPEAMCKQERTSKDVSYVKENKKSCPHEIFNRLIELNAEGRPIWKPMHMQPIFEERDFISIEDKPVCEDIFERGLCLPSDNKMTDDEQDAIIEAVKLCF